MSQNANWYPAWRAYFPVDRIAIPNGLWFNSPLHHCRQWAESFLGIAGKHALQMNRLQLCELLLYYSANPRHYLFLIDWPQLMSVICEFIFDLLYEVDCHFIDDLIVCCYTLWSHWFANSNPPMRSICVTTLPKVRKSDHLLLHCRPFHTLLSLCRLASIVNSMALLPKK